MEAKVKQRILSPRQIELGYHVYQDGNMFYLYYRGELVTFCLATAIPGVLRKAAWRDSDLRNLARAIDAQVEGSNPSAK